MAMHCPECGKPNPPGSVFCNSCGSKIPTVNVEMTVKCPYCGEPGQEYLFNCSKCGKELPRDSKGKPLRLDAERGTKFCRGCGKELGSGVTICPFCGTSAADIWSRTASSDGSYLEDGSDDAIYSQPETAIPIVAGVLLVIAGLLALGQGILYVMADSMVSSMPSYGGYSGPLCLCGGLDILFGLAALGGAYSCFGRKSFWLAAIGAILGMLGFGLLVGFVFGLIGLILVAISKNEFEN